MKCLRPQLSVWYCTGYFPTISEAAMDRLSRDESESRFSTYVEGLVGVIGHADRAVPLRDYCLGLLMPGERKSVEPMAAVTAPARVAAQHQSLLHFVGNAPWSDERVLAKEGASSTSRLPPHRAREEEWLLIEWP